MKTNKNKNQNKLVITHDPVKMWKNANPIHKFIILFSSTVLLFYTTYVATWFNNGPLLKLFDIYVELSIPVLNWIGYKVTNLGGGLLSGESSITIRRGCDALEPFAVYCIGILAFPVTLSKKIKGIIQGAAILFFLNIVRIITLYIVLIYSAEVFDFLHMTFWQILFMAATIILFLNWMSQSTKSIKT